MKVRNIVFSGAMASILMIGAATADALSHDGTKKVNSPATMTNPDYTTAKTSNVNFDGDYTTKDASGASVVNNVAETLTEYTFNYSGTNADGTAKAVNDVNVTTGVSKSNFAYTTKTGSTTDETLASDKTYTASDYDAPTAANGTNAKVAGDYKLDAATSVQKSSYSYADAQNAGEYVELGDSVRTLKSSFKLSNEDQTDFEYTSQTSTINGNLYTFTDEATGTDYMLNGDGTAVWYADSKTAADPDGNQALADLFAAQKKAYADDMTALGTKTSALGTLQEQEDSNYNAAKGVFDEDTTTQGKLATYFATYTDAVNAYETATSATSAFETTKANWETASTDYTNALAMYNTSIIDTVDSEIAANNVVITEQVEGLIAEKEANMSEQLGYNVANNPANEKAEKSLVNSLKMNEDKETGKITSVVGAINENTKAIADEAGVRSVMDKALADRATASENAIAKLNGNAETEGSVAYGDAQTLASAQSYAKSYADAGDLALSGKIAEEAAARANEDAKLQSAIDANRNDIAMLDSKMNDLDENLSAGIASSVALSSVAVANVQKGEMSIGGGYGNYNSKSAMAFGAALGITDNWSANAGVGFGFGKDTKASFRVGTNYKFKLF
ncbi:MAG: YadA C-terminal domain-containing protein [Proteobacteria bacterium]|nr:YadA C-terminal domain-containing protein [Candidatus Enterousia scatequi]